MMITILLSVVIGSAVLNPEYLLNCATAASMPAWRLVPPLALSALTPALIVSSLAVRMEPSGLGVQAS